MNNFHGNVVHIDLASEDAPQSSIADRAAGNIYTNRDNVGRRIVIIGGEMFTDDGENIAHVKRPCGTHGIRGMQLQPE